MTTHRIDLSHAAPAVYRAVSGLDESTDFDPALRELIRIRASQLNGCSYCVDYHTADALAAGERDRRIHSLSVWRKTPFFSDRERAALALAEVMTQLPTLGVPDDVYAEAARHFSERELGNLMGVIIAINAWNLVGVATGLAPEPDPEPAGLTA